MKIGRVCINCSNILVKYQKKFCSINCKIIYNKNLKKISKKIIEQICIICGNKFIAKSKLNICCSSLLCKKKLILIMNKKSRERKKLRKKSVISNCRFCGKIFEKIWHKQYKYCSEKCKKKQRHIDEQNKRHIKYHNNKYHRQCIKLRTGILTQLKIAKVKKLTTINELLGCTYKQFFEYIENKFKPQMSWENHGFFGWHYDHIKPLSSFNLTKKSEQLKAFHYTNYQPLWWYENLQKSDKVEA